VLRRAILNLKKKSTLRSNQGFEITFDTESISNVQKNPKKPQNSPPAASSSSAAENVPISIEPSISPSTKQKPSTRTRSNTKKEEKLPEDVQQFLKEWDALDKVKGKGKLTNRASSPNLKSSSSSSESSPAVSKASKKKNKKKEDSPVISSKQEENTHSLPIYPKDKPKEEEKVSKKEEIKKEPTKEESETTSFEKGRSMSLPFIAPISDSSENQDNPQNLRRWTSRKVAYTSKSGMSYKEMANEAKKKETDVVDGETAKQDGTNIVTQKGEEGSEKVIIW